MPDYRIPKSTKFGWLPQPRPRCGPKKKWKDVIRRHFIDIEVLEKEWYEEAVRLRAEWSTLCRDGLQCWTERERERERERLRVRAPVAVRDVM